MSNLLDTSKEITALIQILTKKSSDTERFNGKRIYYSIQLSFLGPYLLPPYLPRLEQVVDQPRRQEILESLDELRKDYSNCFANDLELDDIEAKKILQELRRIGHLISTYFEGFRDILKYLSIREVKHVIFHTDDYAIPWPWAHYYLEDNYLPDSNSDDHDFLANRISCGTILADGDDGALQRFKHYIEPHTDDIVHPEREVCLIQGVLGHSESDHKKSRAYVQHFNNIFAEGFDTDHIKTIFQKDWDKQFKTKNKKTNYGHAFVEEFLSPQIRDARIIHYSGHIEDGVLLFDDNIRVTSKQLANSLQEFTRKPLVILHGCSSAKIINIDQKDKQLPTIFLEKGASGCIVALLPVDQPIELKANSKSMIDLFYNNVIKGKEYGKALLEARHKFQQFEKTKYNPQWLFFTLYGDPRANFKSYFETSDLNKIMELENRIEKENLSKTRSKEPEIKTKGRLVVSLPKTLLDKDVFISELESYDSVEITKIEPRRVLSDPNLIMTEFQKIISDPNFIGAFTYILDLFKEVAIIEIIHTALLKYLGKQQMTIVELTKNETKVREAEGANDRLVKIGYNVSVSGKKSTIVTYEVVSKLKVNQVTSHHSGGEG